MRMNMGIWVPTSLSTYIIRTHARIASPDVIGERKLKYWVLTLLDLLEHRLDPIE